MNDIGGLYNEGRERLSEMVRHLSPAELGRTVPACPKWTVQDVIAHLAGGCADLLADNIDGVTTAEWADAQVQRRKGHTITEVLEEWSDVGPRLAAIAGSLPSPLATIWALDLAAHEQDVRGAIGQPGARETQGLALAVDFLLREGVHRQLVGRGLGRVSVRTPVRSWTVGEEGGDEAEMAVELSLFEAFRALTGRRSSEQVARYDWTSDPERLLPAFEFGIFFSRTTDLHE